MVGSDFLAYRFPGKEIVKNRGRIQEVFLTEDIDGFIFSDFAAHNFYKFQVTEEEGSIPAEFHSYPFKPYVYTTREYLLQAHSFLNGIAQFQLDKAVFSRVKPYSFPSSKGYDLFLKLCETYPKALVYLVSSDKLGTWIAATPEILLEAHQSFVFTMSLAGTKKASQSEEPWGEKEKVEQQLVTDFIENQLKKAGAEQIELVGPYDYQAGPVTHLRTDLSAFMPSGKIVDFVKVLHPTPAVSGVPRDAALNLISSVEAHDRFLYTGIVGKISKTDATLYVNLRCAQLQTDTAYLYLGGGYTPQSIPELELDETENKSKTLISCMFSVNK
jgi:isochorismate synthase